MIRRHKTASGVYDGGNVRRELEGWTFLIAGSVFTFSIGLFAPMVASL